MFRAIALGGGGVRAGLHVGALKAIEAIQGHLNFPDGIWGCSAGSIVATAVAFRMSAAQIEDLYTRYLDLSAVLTSPRLALLAKIPTVKGAFSMDALETELITMFKAYDIDLTTKRIAETPQPLYIVASNMTTQRVTAFTGQVRILDAIKCSSCIPLVFEPQILYNNVYLDGGIHADCLDTVVPPECLVLHISETARPLYPSSLSEIGLSEYIYSIYRGTRGRPTSPNVIWLQNSTVGILQEMSPADKRMLVSEGDSQTRAFFAKRFPEKLNEPVNRALPSEVDEK